MTCFETCCNPKRTKKVLIQMHPLLFFGRVGEKFRSRCVIPCISTATQLEVQSSACKPSSPCRCTVAGRQSCRRAMASATSTVRYFDTSYYQYCSSEVRHFGDAKKTQSEDSNGKGYETLVWKAMQELASAQKAGNLPERWLEARNCLIATRVGCTSAHAAVAEFRTSTPQAHVCFLSVFFASSGKKHTVQCCTD